MHANGMTWAEVVAKIRAEMAIDIMDGLKAAEGEHTEASER
jgi:hypothetical protein